MKIERTAFHFHNVEKGTAATLYHDKAIAESRDETNWWEELRQAATCKQTDKDGKEQTVWKAMIVDDPPFNGRLAFALESKEGEKSFAIFSLHAFDVMCEKHFGKGNATDLALCPIDSTPASDSGSYAVINGKMNDIPCLDIVSKDRQRAIIVASHKPHVLDSVLDKILGPDRIKSSVGVDNKDFIERWDLLRERMEIIAITVRTADQAFNALAKYRSYLEDCSEVE
jgi:hypothetical protein